MEATMNENRVELIGYYGGDVTHALSAWTSTARELTAERRERLPNMLHTLAKNGHHTPFEKSALHFLVTCDIASHIHLLKHRIGVSINAESARYKELKDDKFYVPTDWPEWLQESLVRHMADSYDSYHAATEALVQGGFSRKRAKESARFFLPYANQITADVMFNFRSFMHFCGLRADSHAQLEIHTIAKLMLSAVGGIKDFKHSLDAFGWGELKVQG